MKGARGWGRGSRQAGVGGAGRRERGGTCRSSWSCHMADRWPQVASEDQSKPTIEFVSMRKPVSYILELPSRSRDYSRFLLKGVGADFLWGWGAVTGGILGDRDGLNSIYSKERGSFCGHGSKWKVTRRDVRGRRDSGSVQKAGLAW